MSWVELELSWSWVEKHYYELKESQLNSSQLVTQSCKSELNFFESIWSQGVVNDWWVESKSAMNLPVSAFIPFWKLNGIYGIFSYWCYDRENKILHQNHVTFCLLHTFTFTQSLNYLRCYLLVIIVYLFILVK